MSNLFAFGDKVIGGGESSQSDGHIIQDSSGTAMTPQPNLQFADANVSNDSTNNATVVRNFVDIDWDDWQEVDDNDNTYYRVTDAPLVDGNVEVDLMKKLWENSAPTASFVAQNITLASDDYDFLLVVSRNHKSENYDITSIVEKGHNIYLDMTWYGTSGTVVRQRSITYVSDTSYSVGNCTQGGSTNNDGLIPLAVYGIKQKVSISLSAIISNVSTRADHCFLDDEVTTVEDALDNRTVIINCTSPVNTSTLREIDYPDGFNKNNTMILGTQVLHISNGYWYAPLGFMIYTTPTKIVISSSNSTTTSFDNRPMRIAICKATPIS